MNRDELLAKWDSMTPRERDALVAEKVFGVTVDMRWHEFIYDITTQYRYSTDISAAWEVVDVYPVIEIEIVEIFKGNKTVKVTAWSGFDHHSEVKVTAKTAPEAICKASLLSLISEETL